MGRVFPREWDSFVALVPELDRNGNLAAAYAHLLANPDSGVRDEAAKAWCAWEDTHVSLMPGWAPDPRYDDAAFRLLFATLVTHYWGNYCFLPDGDQLARIATIADVPAVLTTVGTTYPDRWIPHGTCTRLGRRADWLCLRTPGTVEADSPTL